MIHIVDYGVGNVQAFVNMYKRLGIETTRAASAHDLLAAKKVILPGVGAFDHAMALLNASGMREQLDRMVLQQGVPVLGICVGMQMLANGSDEGGEKGLGWVKGRVRSFASHPASAALPMPHMGWNDVAPVAGSSGALLKGLEKDARFYFLHSYYFEPTEADEAVAITDYGLEFACAVQRGHVSGVQFHPEKSHHWGAALLKNFAEL
ncbi:MAG: imidazole glycerol phosphate synthase subunit HisH [Hydrogenophaga sp.]|nr:imidazole glycerol phosphate synthase subunit HisH [Hydrogenophaga sp.]